MVSWHVLPVSTPSDGQLCWVRAYYYFGVPFLARFDLANQKFVSYINSFDFPLYVVASWRPATDYNLILNGSFSSNDYWTVNSPNYIDSGKCILPVDNENDVYQLLSLSTGLELTLDFDISDLSGTSNIKFTNQSYASLFDTPYDGYNTISNGHYSWPVTVANDSDRFNFYKTYGATQFSITGFVLSPR